MTPIHAAVLAFIRAELSEGRQPTLNDVAAHIGHRNRSSVHRIVDDLQAEGFLQRGPNRRGFVVTERERLHGLIRESARLLGVAADKVRQAEEILGLR